MQRYIETLKGEQLKTLAENSLHAMGESRAGQKILKAYAFDSEGRIEDSRLATSFAGVEVENPIMVGAGWDKKGRAIHGLYCLGFSSVEVGTVTPEGQPGNPKPRLWMVDSEHRIGLNHMGFNSPGMDAVAGHLELAQPLPFPMGVSAGRNKITSNEAAAEDHQKIIKRLGSYASYIALAISTPGSPGVRDLQNKEFFREQIQAAKAVLPPTVPLFVKIDGERSADELDDMIDIGLEEGLDGFVATNTYMSKDLKAKYGTRWADQPGGLSGADPEFRALSTEVIRFIYEAAGNQLAIIGVGAVDSTEAALEKMGAGASAVQVVTAMRPSLGKVAARINRGLLERIERDGVSGIRNYIGIDTKRGVKA